MSNKQNEQLRDYDRAIEFFKIVIEDADRKRELTDTAGIADEYAEVLEASTRALRRLEYTRAYIIIESYEASK